MSSDFLAANTFDEAKQSGQTRRVSRRAFLKTTSLTVIASSTGVMLVACGEDATPAPPPLTAAPPPGSQPPIVPGFSTPLAAPTAAPVGNATTARATTAPATTAAARPTTAAPTTAALPTTSPVDTASAYLKAWEQNRYADMYGFLSSIGKNFISQENFVTRYTNIAAEASLLSVQAAVAPGFQPPAVTQMTVEIPFKATFKTGRVGDFSQDNKLSMRAEGDRWLIDWNPAHIFKELDNTTYLVRMLPSTSTRGEIFDRTGQLLTAPALRYEVFVVPGQIENEEQLLNNLSQLLSMDKERIKNLYKNGQPTWRMPIKELTGSTPPDVIANLRSNKGVGVDEGQVRSYPQGPLAGHITGYVGKVTADDLKRLSDKGYTEEEVIGKSGVEAWGQEILAGKPGGKLTVVRRDGGTVATLVERPATPPANMVLTLDLGLQRKAEAALGGRMGSVVVLDPNNGAVLALASFPTYDPNIFITGVTSEQFKALNDDPRRPFQNRAVNGQLPIGSTFKAITTAAALEKLGINMQTRFTCTGRWTGLGPQAPKDCYIKTGHGSITLFEGLAQSCDVVYYELGKRLDELDPNVLPEMTKAFGMGSSTGIQGIFDSPGQVPDPKWKLEKLKQGWVRGDAVNLAIGQGYFLASPLQLAVAYAAIANGGNVITPRLIERAEGTSPEVSRAFGSQTRSKLPVSEGNLNEIRRALLAVTQGGLGTARGAFAGSRVAVAGKTGTAESGVEAPHAWFACYAPANQPRYVVVVMLENGGFGNEQAAPVARKVIDGLPF